MEKLLFIHTNDFEGKSGGSQRTVQAKSGLSNFFNVITYMPNKKHNRLKTFMLSFLGLLKCSLSDIRIIKKMIKNGNINIVYFDDSVNGLLLKKLKKNFSNIYYIVNFHNDEKKYYHDLLKGSGFTYLTLYIAAIINQTYSTTLPNFKIFITETDEKTVNGKKNIGLSSIIPVMIKDEFRKINPQNNECQSYFLFFGYSFYPNNEAALFIINKIAPNFKNEHFIIAGSGMDETFSNVCIPENVRVFGFVENKQELFSNAKAFLCPIFNGSGMKVKIAEALMNGKTIIGTSFSCIGYDINNAAFEIANTKEEFIAKIKNYNADNFNSTSRTLFLERYDLKNNAKYYKVVYENFILTTKGMASIKKI